jgi:hypothetical protein
MMALFKLLSQLVIDRFSERFRPYEVRASINQIASRWKHILSDEEKKKISRTLGGNRYAKTTYEVLDVIFTEIVERDGNAPDGD